MIALVLVLFLRQVRRNVMSVQMLHIQMTPHDKKPEWAWLDYQFRLKLNGVAQGVIAGRISGVFDKAFADSNPA